MNHWCESCARKNLCYVVGDRPKCFVPITNTASGTPESYLAKSLRYSRDSHEIAKDEPTISKMEQVDWKDQMWAEAVVTEPTISKMEQVEDDSRLTAKCLNCANGGSYKCSECDGEMYFKDEPQTYVINPQEPTNDDKCFECDDFFTCDGQCDEIEDEPQTVRSNLEPFRVDEPQTDEEYINSLPWTEVGNGEQTDCPWK